ncbi:MAG TPA: EamA family transporter [Lachnospiraceae bacterium]|nr:EamA family transporter [Lachnospiraceae bacterium]
MKKEISIQNLIKLQLVVIIYSLSSVCAKAASGYTDHIFSKEFLTFSFLELCLLGIYAVLWQQVIKRYDLSVAYANRAIALVWSMIWAFLIYNEKITLVNIIGAAVVLLGIMIINSDKGGTTNE